MEQVQDHILPIKVAMVAYNQERYIAQAIESVLMQKTDVAYRLIIGDDCSTDSTADICNSYAKKFPGKITFIRNPKNLGLLANYKQLLSGYPAKYIAILEGDDYWTDEYKLQKQYDILEEHPEVGLVHSDCDLLYESGKLQSGSHQRHLKSIKNINLFDQLLYENYIRPATVIFRQKLYDKYVPIDEYIRLDFKTFDYPLWLDISKYTQFYYLKYSTAVYRIHGASISNSNQYNKSLSFFKSIYGIKQYSLNKTNLSKQVKDKLLNRSILDIVTIEIEAGHHNEVFELRDQLRSLNLMSFAVRFLTMNRFFVSIYMTYLKIRGRMQREGFNLFFSNEN